jgi:DNA-binding transcriptional LysR family regulator
LLEEELGAPLFHRHPRGVALTPAGQRLLPYAVQVAHLLGDARRAVADDGTPAGTLHIGSLETTAAVRLSPLLTAFASAYPAVDLVLSTGTTGELIERVIERQIEGAFVCGPVDHPAVVGETVFREELAVVTAPGVRHLDDLTKREGMKIVVLRAGCSYRQRLEEILNRRGIAGLRRLEFGTIDGIVGCVAAGLGVTLLPQSIVAAAARDGRVAVHPLPASDAHVDTVFIRRHDALLTSALAAFLRLVGPAGAQADAAE